MILAFRAVGARLMVFCSALYGFSPVGLQAEPLEYNRDIRPILADHCFACHGADSASRKADLRLDQREAAIEMFAIAPGNPEESEVWARIISDDPDLVMPPPETKKTLTADQKEKIRQWLLDGAEYQAHWSFIKPEQPVLPEVKNAGWPKTPIDHFILAALEAESLTPAAEAEPYQLFRRLHLDITGLPPEPADLDAFVADYQMQGDQALSAWIDRLMSSTSWGEHRARYWLDAARYGDTHGLHFDNYREMWPYRDWVIRAFNRNQPFNEFTIEQLAGDLLPNPTTDQLIATGFQRCNITTNEGGTIDEENLANYASDRVQTFGWVFLGLTTNCAQCHDHKFDPITMKDYYSLAAFFRNTTQGPKDGNVKDGRGPFLRLPTEADLPRWEALPNEIATAIKNRDEYRKQEQPTFQEWLNSNPVNDLAARLPAGDLQLHLTLMAGQENSVKAEAPVDQVFASSGQLQWMKNGPQGTALIVQPDTGLSLPEQGNFQKDQGFSYGAWVRPDNNTASAAIFARMDEAAAHRGWDLWQNGNSYGIHIIDSWPENAIKVVTQNPSVKAKKWQHVFATYDGSGKAEGVKLYVDGELQPTRVDKDTLKPEASIQTEVPLKIGQRNNSAVFAGGAIYDLRLYGRTLTPAEVKVLAEYQQLEKLLAIDPDKRKPEQTKQLEDYYFNSLDLEFPQLAQRVIQLENEQKAIENRSPITHIQEEKPNSVAMTNMLIRGEYDRPADEVIANTPENLHPLQPDAPRNRLGLALWVVDEQNPLTRRVYANRFWQQVFGHGIVATTEDFGITGMLPSNPELLDWLAIDFAAHGWDVKRFFKQIFMSATYRQAAIITPEKLERDRDNSLLSRGPRFRMDAEMLRDSALAVSGLLSDKMYGPGVKPYQPVNVWNMVGLPNGNTREYEQSTGEDLYRRTVYSFWKRMAPPPNLEAFNAPSREVCTVRRERTNTPLQALVTLNDPQFVEAARLLAERALAGSSDVQAAALETISRRVLGRKLLPAEQQIIEADLAVYLAYYQANPQAAESLLGVGEAPRNAKLDAATHASWTMICNQFMNLDEFLNK